MDTQTSTENKAVIKDVLKYGRTPVIYGPTRSMVRPPATPGLSNLIKQATTVKEVKNLLDKGKSDYKNASPGTVRSWEKIAEEKISQLSK